MSLHILKAGPMTTLQDLGRRGYLRYGVNQSGAMDPVAASVCWQLLGQSPDDTPLVEIPLGGLQVAVDAPTSLAVVSTGFSVSRSGAALGASALITLLPGETLDVRPGTAGQFAYLGVHANWDIAPVLGAYATHLRSGVGPAPALNAGDTLGMTPHSPLDERLNLPPLDHGPSVLRAVDGPQLDYFPVESVDRFYSQPWTVGAASDRMASALIGEPLTHEKGFDILSDGIAFGAVQVPGSGQPFVLMADRGTTGGYPKIATVISADLPRIAQARPGTVLHFERVSVEQANATRLRQKDGMLAWLRTPAELDTERLMTVNLISGVVDGHTPPA